MTTAAARRRAVRGMLSLRLRINGCDSNGATPMLRGSRRKCRPSGTCPAPLTIAPSRPGPDDAMTQQSASDRPRGSHPRDHHDCRSPQRGKGAVPQVHRRDDGLMHSPGSRADQHTLLRTIGTDV